MIKTYKIKHGRDLSKELVLARKVAQFAIENRDKLSTKYVRHYGLKAVISAYVLKKYGFDRKCKKVTRVKLGISPSHIKIAENRLYLQCLKLYLDISYLPKFKKYNAIELDEIYAYIPIEISEKRGFKPKGILGVDRNTTKHAIVAADLTTNKVLMLGKSTSYIANKYKNIRKNLQNKGKYNALKKIKDRQAKKTKDLNHKISRKLVDYAYENKLEIRMENLKGIKNRKAKKSFKYALNSWPYYQLQAFVDYKAKQLGVPLSFVAPQYTSKLCSHCGLIGTRSGKLFKCPNGHVAHADINAAYNIGQRSLSYSTEK